jgi:hypothetical protein
LHYDLTKLAHERFTITNDDDARTFLVQQGVQTGFDTGHLAKPVTNVVVTYDNPSHWILCFIHDGHANPSQNGYVVDCIPKSRFSKEKFDAHVEDMKKKNTTGPPMRHVQKPSSN